MADILQDVGESSVYAIDSVLMDRPGDWNYRTGFLYSREFQ
jgi:hypothetical protein